MPEINEGSVLIGSMALSDELDRNWSMNSNSYWVYIAVFHVVKRAGSYF
jgi:hypothetical protein